MPIDPQLVPFLKFIEAGTPFHEDSVAGARRSFRTLTVDMRRPESVVPVGSLEEATVVGAAGDLPARVYRPAREGPFPTVAMFHGGGFVIGDLDTHDNMARAICSGADAVVVSVDYRLAPEHKFPAAAEDAIAATKDILSRLAEFGGTDVFAVAGDSAGGNLSAVAAQHVPSLAAQFLLYPMTDALSDFASREANRSGYFLDEPTIAWFMAQYADTDTDLADPRLSPLKGRLEGLPPAVLVTAEFDPLRDEGVRYAEGLQDAGVPVKHKTYDGIIHGFIDMGPISDTCRRAVDEAIAAFAATLRR